MSPSTSAWSGWRVFAGIVIIITGAIDALKGLSAVLLPSEDVVIYGTGNVLWLDVNGWGWWHLIIGTLLVLVGIALLAGQTWARVTAVVLVSLNAVSQLFLLDVQPWWSLAVLALDVVVIYALTVHGRESDD
ncbi:hypothetical protein ACFQRL_13450 [Microbacterium fluvii]|uniref:DUF7144 domain-containing protein n=1 Tax=Microbacterium fluvii TaxID=415215 RepID=A0ABW2HGD2_9MICO|nr:hypothetical protein [Microbacterium fluvii]MCU4673596.1 hypothetical protein [Microbacterium fluvii]